jgi:hypothetical protein
MTPNGVDLGLYVQTTCGTQNTQIACSDFGAVGGVENLSIPVTAGQQVTIFVDGFASTDAGSFTLTVSNQAGAPEGCFDNVDNDGDALTDCADSDCTTACSNMCALPTHIPTLPATLTGNTTGHNDTFDPTCLNAGGGDVAYTFVVPPDGNFTVNLTSSTNMGFYFLDGCLGAGTQELFCRNNLSGGGTETANLTATPGGILFMIVAGFNAAGNGSYTLNIVD